jgi:uncharacterized coiled-coil DUF342 family protein
MTEERFTRIEATLEVLVTGQAELRAEVGGLKSGQASLSAKQDDLGAKQDDLRAQQDDLSAKHDRLSAKQDSLSAKQDNLSAKQDSLLEGHQALRADFADLRSDVQELRRHMGVLHEDIIDRIKALALPVEDIQRQIRAGDAAVRADLGARLDVVEAALRLRRRPRRGH